MAHDQRMVLIAGPGPSPGATGSFSRQCASRRLKRSRRVGLSSSKALRMNELSSSRHGLNLAQRREGAKAQRRKARKQSNLFASFAPLREVNTFRTFMPGP